MKRSNLCALALFVVFGCGVNTSPGEGDKVGQIVRLQRVGMASKTWEGEIIRGGMSGGSGVIGMTPFDFTIENEELATAVRGFMDNQTEVTIHYRSEGVYSACRTESRGHFLVSIEPAKK
jgi:hypothetical protein